MFLGFFAHFLSYIPRVIIVRQKTIYASNRIEIKVKLKCCPFFSFASENYRGIRSGSRDHQWEQLSYETAGSSTPGRTRETPKRSETWKGVWLEGKRQDDCELLKGVKGKKSQQGKARKHSRYHLNETQRIAKEIQLKFRMLFNGCTLTLACWTKETSVMLF